MNRWTKVFKRLLVAIALATTAPLIPQERFRLADPQVLSANGSGWSVNPRTGGLSMVLPVGRAGVEIPIPISLRVSGQFTTQSAIEQQYLDPNPLDPLSKPRWTYVGTSDVVRPAFATVHLGYIAPAARFDGPTGSEIIVLEDGAQFRSEDLVPFTSWNPTFTLPQDFSFPAVTPSAAQVTTMGSHALYSTTSASLGATWGSRILALSPVGFGVLQDAYRVLMDKDRARVLVQVPDSGLWVPILWVDRFGHYVELKWQKDMLSLPAGMNAKYTVTVKNQRGQGALLQWADFGPQETVQDLICVDLLGMGNPGISIVVQGYPGVSTLHPDGAPAGNPAVNVVAGRVAGPIGRPTHVRIGYIAVIEKPAWAQAALPQVPMMPPPAGQPIPLRSWSFEWDLNHASIKAMTDALGVRTAYTCGAQIIPTTQSYYYQDPTDPTLSRYRMGDLTVWGVTRTDSFDAKSGKTLSRTWTPGTLATGEPTAVLRELYGDPATALRWTELVFAKSTDALGRDYGNGALKESRLWETGKSSPSASMVYSLQGAGLDGTYSARAGMVITRLGEPTRTVASSLDPLGLFETAQTQFVGTSPVKVQETLTTPESLRDKLIPGRPIQVTVTQYATNGAAITPAVVTKTEYDTQGLPSKQYRALASGQLGSSYLFDGEGRLKNQIPLSDIPFTMPPLTGYGYDPVTGLLAAQETMYQPYGGTVRVPLTRSFSNFDGAGRPQTIQDERGLVTQQTYDLLGRVSGITPPAGLPTTISYPDEWTRVTTQGAAVTTERIDGFGHLISRDLPDGASEELAYDEFGRQSARVVISNAAPRERRNAAQTLYDALDRPTTITSPGGASQGLAYSVDPAFPWWSLTTRTLNTPGTISSSQEYRDALGQVVRQVSPKGDVTEIEFNGLSLATKVTLTPSGGGTQQIRQFTYDESGRMLQRSEPETGITTFSNFNSFGQPTTITEAEGRVRTLAYDGLGRLVRMAGGSESLSYTFNGLDLASASSVTNGVTVGQRFEYLGPAKQLSLEETSQPGLLSQIGYGYDAVTARLNAITYPNGRVVGYTRDPLGRVTAISQNGSPVVTRVSFDSWGNRSRLSFASGAYSDWKAKDFGVHLDQWNIGYVAGSGTTTALDAPRFFQYDSAERLTMAGDWDHLEHDVQGRLLVANSTSLGISTSHAHDAYDNNTAHTATGAVPAGTLNPFAFNPMPDNRIPPLQANGVTTSGWILNGRGEATQVGVATGSTQALGLAWDGLGHLRAVVYGGGTQSYVYAPSGMRVALMESASTVGTRRYAYTNSGLLLSEYRDPASTAALMALPGLAAAKPSSVKTKATTTSVTSKTAGGLAYLLPSIIGPVNPAGAWIVQPAGAATVTVGQAVAFEGGTDFGTTLTWTFGDGSSAAGAIVSHAFSTAGTYTATFTARGRGYLTSTAGVQITVVPPVGPAIGTFTTSAGTIGEGGYADLTWSASNATSASISGVGAVAAVGTTRVWPTTTTVYALTVSGPGGTVTSTVQVNVVPAPVIQVFVSEPATIQPGQSAKLTWTVTNANAYSLDQGIGVVNGTWAVVWPGGNTTFTLTATNTLNGVSVTRSASTTVVMGAASGTTWKRDVIYLGSEAIAEIDAAGIHELHNNHLGSPTIITNGTSGQIEGKQVFGPFGERVLSQGTYVPLTGYTGHVQQDATGLIYMRGRYYSPAWHRFVNSDQGADPTSWNQMAYTGGKPFSITDPSGMNILEDIIQRLKDAWDNVWGGGSTSTPGATVSVVDDMPLEIPLVDASYNGGPPEQIGLIPRSSFQGASLTGPQSLNYLDQYKKWSAKYQDCMSKNAAKFSSQKATAVSGLRSAVNSKMTSVINNWAASMNANRQGLISFGVSDGVGLAFGLKSGAASMGRGFVQTRATVFGLQTSQAYFNLFMGQTSLADWEDQQEAGINQLFDDALSSYCAGEASK